MNRLLNEKLGELKVVLEKRGNVKFMSTDPKYFLRVLQSDDETVGKALERAKELAQFLNGVDQIDGGVSDRVAKQCKAAGGKMWLAQQKLLDASLAVSNAIYALENELKQRK